MIKIFYESYRLYLNSIPPLDRDNGRQMKSISRNFLFSIIIISIFLGSCANQSGSSSNSSSSFSGSNSDTDKKAPELLEIQSVRNPTNNTTPPHIPSLRLKKGRSVMVEDVRVISLQQTTPPTSLSLKPFQKALMTSVG